MIEIEDLSKSYGNLQVINGLSLRVAAGEVYGLLGPNGVGKSTLLHLILGFLKPTSGRLRVLGSSNLDSTRAQIGYIPERQRYHTRYSAREYLSFIGKFSGMHGHDLITRVEQELQTVGLDMDADRTMGTFSKGMLQRVGVAQALLCDPALLLIDEPTSGLDPVGQREVIDLLGKLRDRGHTVFLCTHYLHEIEQLCDRVGVLTGGKIAVEARVRDLRAPGGSVMIEVDAISTELRGSLQAISRGVSCDARTVRIRQNTPQIQATVLHRLLDAGAAIIALEPMESPLEQLYVRAVRGTSAAQQPPNLLMGTLEPPPILPRGPSVAPEYAAPSSPLVRQPGEGDTLLNELLRRGGSQDSSESGDGSRESGDGGNL
ncbi:ABC transporter ATP-binding protein [Chloroflexales bacterium ZM16-3]|nr:ABC transporter ATP-binding protein [Chloroflexales bacterium ZM16-3]